MSQIDFISTLAQAFNLNGQALNFILENFAQKLDELLGKLTTAVAPGKGAAFAEADSLALGAPAEVGGGGASHAGSLPPQPGGDPLQGAYAAISAVLEKLNATLEALAGAFGEAAADGKLLTKAVTALSSAVTHIDKLLTGLSRLMFGDDARLPADKDEQSGPENDAATAHVPVGVRSDVRLLKRSPLTAQTKEDAPPASSFEPGSVAGKTESFFNDVRTTLAFCAGTLALIHLAVVSLPALWPKEGFFDKVGDFFSGIAGATVGAAVGAVVGTTIVGLIEIVAVTIGVALLAYLTDALASDRVAPQEFSGERESLQPLGNNLDKSRATPSFAALPNPQGLPEGAPPPIWPLSPQLSSVQALTPTTLASADSDYTYNNQTYTYNINIPTQANDPKEIARLVEQEITRSIMRSCNGAVRC